MSNFQVLPPNSRPIPVSLLALPLKATSMRPKSEFPQTFDFEHVVTESEQAADLEILKQLTLADTPLAHSVAPRLRMLRLIASRHEVIYTHPKAHWYKMKGWREVLECGHEHHVYQVEDLTAKRRNCPTCAKAAQLQNADELIQTLADDILLSPQSTRRSQANGGENDPAPKRTGEIAVRESREPEGGLTTGDRCQPKLADAQTGLTARRDEQVTPPKQPSQSVLRHKEKSA